MREKIFDRDTLAGKLAELRRGGNSPKIVFTNGCFDLLHVGHLRYLWAARQEGDLLIVAINDDASVRRLKGEGRPILKLDERLRVLEGLACVDFVTWFEEDTPIPLLDRLRPDILVKGATYTVEGVVGHELVLGYGGEVKTLQLTPGRSTTGLIEKVIASKQGK
jgi:D-beta-D-heptose 7-phosphate kinase/D-beta-D-heptose 1-phosphate adenosyltransferase